MSIPSTFICRGRGPKETKFQANSCLVLILNHCTSKVILNIFLKCSFPVAAYQVLCFGKIKEEKVTTGEGDVTDPDATERPSRFSLSSAMQCDLFVSFTFW